MRVAWRPDVGQAVPLRCTRTPPGHFKIVREIEIVLSNHDRMSLHLYLSPRSISLKVTSVGVLKGLGSRWIEIVPFTDFHRRYPPVFAFPPSDPLTL